MKAKVATAYTGLSTRECAEVFQQATTESRGLGSKIAGAIQDATDRGGLEYFTPTDDSPFAQFEDKHDFSVGVLIPRWVGGAKGAAHAIHMYVRDQGDHREAEFVVPHNFGDGRAASKLLGKFIETFRMADPSVRIQI